jgi:hypothetical protein
MTYTTLLLIFTLGGEPIGFLTYPSEAACTASIAAVTDTLEADYRVECVKTLAPTTSIRPKGRTKG